MGQTVTKLNYHPAEPLGLHHQGIATSHYSYT